MAVVHKTMELGAGLNFKIVGGTTQPSSPKENTIWIETDTAIGEWQFSATEPTTRADGTALQTGDVWIKTVGNHTVYFNALKKNGIKVYPWMAYQFNGTEWKIKEAKIYKETEWLDFVFRIYKFGDECEDVTGGFVSGYVSSGYYNKGSITKNDDSVTLTAGSQKAIVYRTANKIDMTEFTTMLIHARSASASSSAGARIACKTSETLDVNADASIDVAKEKTVENVITALDISALKGEYYAQASAHANDGKSASITFDEMWFV